MYVVSRTLGVCGNYKCLLNLFAGNAKHGTGASSLVLKAQVFTGQAWY